MLSLVILFGLFVGLFGYQGWVISRRRRLERRSWEDLVARIQSVDTVLLTEISDNYLHPGPRQLRIEPGAMWKAVGGISGLGSLLENANAMLDLARYAERWDSENGRVISEMMRRDASRVKRAVFQVQISQLMQWRMVRAPFQLQEAISSYCLMRGRLLGLYADAHVGRLERLAGAL